MYIGVFHIYTQKEYNIISMGGLNRSVSIVIGYLMQCKGMSYIDALHLVKGKYPKTAAVCVMSNQGFVDQLRQFEIQIKGGEGQKLEEVKEEI